MENRLAIVTGGNSGIGLEAARLLARGGWRTALVARRAGLLAAAAAELSAFRESAAFVADLSDAGATAGLMGRIVAACGPPALLVNNAGAGMYKPFLEHTPEDLERVMRVHCFSPAALIRAATPHMLRNAPVRGARGHVINVSSMSVRMGPWGHAAYGAAKSALRTMTQTLAAEHARDGLRFSVVCPGIVRTPYFDHEPLATLFARLRGHAIEPARVAAAIVGLLERPRLEVCVPGSYRALDAIVAAAPALAHRLVASRSGPSGATDGIAAFTGPKPAR